MQVIVLTAEQAAQIRYADPGVSGLDPIELVDGRFFLGLECLADPRHGALLAQIEPQEIERESIKWVAEAALAEAQVQQKGVKR